MNQHSNTTMDTKTYIGGGHQKYGSEYIALTLDVGQLMDLCSEAMLGESDPTVHLVVARRRNRAPGEVTHVVYAPYVPTEEERLDALRNAVADQQEIEVRAWDEANAE